MKFVGLLLLVIFLASCDNDEYISYNKSGVFTIKELKERGKRNRRGFYVHGSEDKIRYRNIRNGKYKVGDKITLHYDSVINKTKGTYRIEMPSRIQD